VVGRLAERHGIRVRLRESAYGGMMAIVLIPSSLVVDIDDTAPPRKRRQSAQQAALEAGPSAVWSPPGAAWSPQPAPIEPAASDGPEPTVVVEPAAETAPEPTVIVEPAAETAPEPTVIVEPAAETAPEPVTTAGETPNGLPRRVRQANLAAPLQNEPAASLPAPDSDGPRRAPEDIRRMLSSYQRQTRRGRCDAAHVSPADSAAGHLVASATPGENPGNPRGEDH
jgi:hypothetical protein